MRSLEFDAQGQERERIEDGRREVGEGGRRERTGERLRWAVSARGGLTGRRVGLELSLGFNILGWVWVRARVWG